MALLLISVSDYRIQKLSFSLSTSISLPLLFLFFTFFFPWIQAICVLALNMLLFSRPQLIF